MEDFPDEELHVQFEFDLNKHEVRGCASSEVKKG